MIQEIHRTIQVIAFWKFSIVDNASIIIIILIIWGTIDLTSWYYYNSIGSILQIPCYPIVGNLFQVLNNPAKVYMEWSKYYKVGLFQIRLGEKRVVVANSYEDVENLWTKNSRANNSRPISHTFHNIVSATQGFTVGSTPAGETYNRKKKAISMHLNHKNVEDYSCIIDNETSLTIKKIIQINHELTGPPSCNMFRNSRCRIADINLLPYAQFFALKSSVSIAYGMHIDCYNTDSILSKEIIEVESQIIKFRSPIANLSDFLPFLRRIPGHNWKPNHYRLRRDKYMDFLFNSMKKRIAEGDLKAKNSLVGQLITNQSKAIEINFEELKSICLTLISAGLDNTPLNFNHLMGHLSQPCRGELIQERAFSELMTINNDDICEAWTSSALTMNCNYIIALINETLRYFTVLPLSLPRATTKDIYYKGAVIPKNSILFMNAYAANHDPAKFYNPNSFIPERWLNSKNKIKSRRELNHFSFGAGSRMCSGNQLAFKELYTLTARMILCFKIKAPVDNLLMELDPFKNNSNPSATSFEPKLFKVRLESRYHKGSNELYNMILKS